MTTSHLSARAQPHHRTLGAVAREIAALLRDAGGSGTLCVSELGGDREVALHPDRPVAAASVVKLLVAVEFLRRVDAGELFGGERVRCPAAGRPRGTSGLSLFVDDAEITLDDLLRSMVVASDNAATDILLERLGLDAVNRTAVDLGLTATVVPSTVRALFDGVDEDLARRSGERRSLRQVRALSPATSMRTTARDMTRLLRLVWNGGACSDIGAARLRQLMIGQVSGRRLRSAFPAGAVVAAKDGILLDVVRNEVGVVEYPDGGYAVAVFTQAGDPRQAAALDAAIGAAAARAVAELRRRPDAPPAVWR